MIAITIHTPKGQCRLGPKKSGRGLADGTSIYHGGAMCGDTYYDEHGEEC